LLSHGALSAAPEQAFKESANTIEIVRLSLQDRQQAAKVPRLIHHLVMAKPAHLVHSASSIEGKH
jgi:hypothetical protein